MIEGYILYCLSFAVFAILVIYTNAFKIYNAYINEQSMIDEKTIINKYVAAMVFFATMFILAPLISIPMVLFPSAAARGYSKALISLLESNG